MSDNKGPVMLYVIGVPGSGKTTALNLATADATAHVQSLRPVPTIWHQWDEFRLWEIGKHRPGGFGGTDALAYSAQPLVIDWLQSLMPRRVIAEGDRLANGTFFRAVRQLGYDLTLALIDVPDDVACERRRQRALAHGSPPQNESWIKGRVTKIHNLVATWESCVQRYDGFQQPSEVAAELCRHRVFEGLPRSDRETGIEARP